jgi:hypothetical protein
MCSLIYKGHDLNSTKITFLIFMFVIPNEPFTI